jgi:hypothetical protein
MVVPTAGGSGLLVTKEVVIGAETGRLEAGELPGIL